MQVRKLGPYEVTAIGYGAMNLSHAYGPPQPRDVAERRLRQALDLGVTHFDTAALYGFGTNEKLVGDVLGKRPDNVIVASKCGLFGRDGKPLEKGETAIDPAAVTEVPPAGVRPPSKIGMAVGKMAGYAVAGKAVAEGLKEKPH